jgi:acetyl-CoA carboxylase carboxyltransferase component
LSEAFSTGFTWDGAVAELERRWQAARELGGEDKIARQHADGRQTVRERIDKLTDRFHEVGRLARYTERDASGAVITDLASSYVCGLGEVGGRFVAVGGDDFTVRGGAAQMYLDRVKGGMGGFVEDLAHEYRIPLLLFVEGVGGSATSADDKGHVFIPSSLSLSRCYELMAEVPVLCAILGAAAGAAAGRATVSHFSVMSENSVAFAGGPPVVKRSLGIDVDKHELGGARMHTSVSGVIDNLAADDDDAIEQLRRVLSYLPQNVWSLPPRGPRSDLADRRDDALLEIVPENRRRPYSMRAVLEAVADRDSTFEIGAGWGRSLITCLARLDGIPCGMIGNDPKRFGGAMDSAAADKQVRFVDFCSTFHLPLVFFVDVPGFMVGPESEAAGVLRKGMRAVQSLLEAEVPIVTVHVRKAFGMATQATSNPDRLGLRLAWPSAEWGDMPVEGGVAAGFRREIAAADDPEAFRLEIERRLLKASDPWRTVEAFGVEAMIDPRETRPLVAAFLNAAQGAMATHLGPPSRPWRMRP